MFRTHGSQNFKGNIVALSDRINSLLVPKTFMNWSNLHFSGDTAIHPSRVFIKTKDANNPTLIAYFDQHDFHVNKDKIKFSRVKGILQNIVSSLGHFRNPRDCVGVNAFFILSPINDRKE